MRLGDRFGRRRIFMIGLGIFAAASARLRVWRRRLPGWSRPGLVQGVGAALLTPTSLGIIGSAYGGDCAR